MLAPVNPKGSDGPRLPRDAHRRPREHFWTTYIWMMMLLWNGAYGRLLASKYSGIGYWEKRRISKSVLTALGEQDVIDCFVITGRSFGSFRQVQGYKGTRRSLCRLELTARPVFGRPLSCPSLSPKAKRVLQSRKTSEDQGRPRRSLVGGCVEILPLVRQSTPCNVAKHYCCRRNDKIVRNPFTFVPTRKISLIYLLVN
jgi:hypothetical protein